MAMDNSLHRGQSDTGPGKLVVQVEALESAEEPVGVSHIESTAVVAYKIFSRLTGRIGDPELNSGQIYQACEFPGISDQVLHYDA